MRTDGHAPFRGPSPFPTLCLDSQVQPAVMTHLLLLQIVIPATSGDRGTSGVQDLVAIQ